MYNYDIILEYYLHTSTSRFSNNCSQLMIMRIYLEGIGQTFFSTGRYPLQQLQAFVLRPLMTTLQACVARGFGYARPVKEMLKRGGSSILVKNGYTE